MYYYIIYNSSIINKNEVSKRYLTTIMYGTICYILTHAYLSASSSDIVKKIKDYFWLIFVLDIGAMGYLYTQEGEDGSNVLNWYDSIENLRNEVKKHINSPEESNAHIIPILQEEEKEVQKDELVEEEEEEEEEQGEDDDFELPENTLMNNVKSEEDFSRVENERDAFHNSIKQTFNDDINQKAPPVLAQTYNPNEFAIPTTGDRPTTSKSTPLNALTPSHKNNNNKSNNNKSNNNISNNNNKTDLGYTDIKDLIPKPLKNNKTNKNVKNDKTPKHEMISELDDFIADGNDSEIDFNINDFNDFAI